MIQKAVDNAVRQFGGIDIVVNNASAISLTGTEATTMKKYDLMHQCNTRGTYLTSVSLPRLVAQQSIWIVIADSDCRSKLCLPYLRVGKNPHILNISPPLNMNPVWFQNHVAYTMAKYGMSMCVLGMAEEFKHDGIAVNALWPRTGITTAAMDMLGKLMGGEETADQLRFPSIMADAAYVVLTKDARNFTGKFCIDDDVLREVGVTDFDQYAVKPGTPLMPDFFLDEFLTTVAPKENKAPAADAAAAPAAPSAASAGNPVEQVFASITSMLSEEIVQKTNAVYAFDVKGAENGKWFLDLKNGKGSAGKGEPPVKEDALLTMNSEDFVKMFTGYFAI